MTVVNYQRLKQA